MKAKVRSTAICNTPLYKVFLSPLKDGSISQWFPPNLSCQHNSAIYYDLFCKTLFYGGLAKKNINPPSSKILTRDAMPSSILIVEETYYHKNILQVFRIYFALCLYSKNNKNVNNTVIRNCKNGRKKSLDDG